MGPVQKNQSTSDSGAGQGSKIDSIIKNQRKQRGKKEDCTKVPQKSKRKVILPGKE
jgi:hypothetical protein